MEPKLRCTTVLEHARVQCAGFAFVQYEELRDAEDAVEKLNDKNGWRVELARPQRQREAGDNKCVRQT